MSFFSFSRYAAPRDLHSFPTRRSSDVATALADHDPPVAFDVQGNRLVLGPERPPATPVIAVVPVETDFSTTPAAIECLSCGSLWLPPPPPTGPGLYLTKAHFVDDFEGWLKGGPEFEVHILGQKGQTDSLTDYQCAGEKQPTPYYFDQNALGRASCRER